jgi:hypothetical protein
MSQVRASPRAENAICKKSGGKASGFKISPKGMNFNKFEIRISKSEANFNDRKNKAQNKKCP